MARTKKMYNIAHSELRDTKEKLQIAKETVEMLEKKTNHPPFIKGMGLQIISALAHNSDDNIRKCVAEAMTHLVSNKRNFANSAKDKKDTILRSQLSLLGGHDEKNKEIREIACKGLALLIKHMSAVGKEILIMPNAPTVEALFEYAVDKATKPENSIKAFQAISRLADYPENRGPIIETPGLLKRLAVIAEEEQHPSTADASRVLAKLCHTFEYAQTIADIGFFGVISLIEGTVNDQILCAGALATLTKLVDVHDTLLDVGDELVTLGRKDVPEVKLLVVHSFCAILVKSPQLKYTCARFVRDLLMNDVENQTLFLKYKKKEDVVPNSSNPEDKDRPKTAGGARNAAKELLEEAQGKKKEAKPQNPNFLAPPKNILTPLKVIREIASQPFTSAFFEASLHALQTTAILAREEANHMALKKDAFAVLLISVVLGTWPEPPKGDTEAAENSARTAMNEAELIDQYKANLKILMEAKINGVKSLALLNKSSIFHKTFLRRLDGIAPLLELAKGSIPEYVLDLFDSPAGVARRFQTRMQKWVLVCLGNIATNPSYRPQLLKENLLPFLLDVIPELKLKEHPRWTDNDVQASKKMHANVVFAIQALYNLTKNADIGQELEESGAFHKLTPLLCENDLTLVRWTATTLGNMVNTMTSYPQMEESLPLLLRLCDIQLDAKEYFRWPALLEAQLAAAEFLSNFAADNPDTLDHIQPFDGLERVMQMCNRYLHVLCVSREGLEYDDNYLDLNLVRKNLLPAEQPTVLWRNRQVPNMNWDDLDITTIVTCNRILSEGALIVINIMTHVPDDDIEDFTDQQAINYTDYAIGFIDVDGEEDGMVSAKAFDDEKLQHAAIAAIYRLVTCDKFEDPPKILRKHEDTTGFICLAAGSSHEEVQSQSQQIIGRMVQEFTTLSQNQLLSNYITDVERMKAVHFNLPQCLCNLTKSQNDHLKKFAVAILCQVEEGFMPLKEVRQELLAVGALNIIVGLSCSEDKYLEMYGMRALAYLTTVDTLAGPIVEAGALNKLVARCTDYLQEKPEKRVEMSNLKTVRAPKKKKEKGGKKYEVMNAGEELRALNRPSELIDPSLVSADPKHLFKVASYATASLANLARFPSNRAKIADEGGVDLFLSLLQDTNFQLRAYASQGLSYLALENEIHGELSDADAIDALIDSLELDAKKYPDMIQLMQVKRKQWEGIAKNPNFRRGIKQEKGATRAYSDETVEQTKWCLVAQCSAITALANLATNPTFVTGIMAAKLTLVEFIETSPDARVIRACVNCLSELSRYTHLKEELIKHCVDAIIDLGCMPVATRDPVLVKMMVLAFAELGAADKHRPDLLEHGALRALVSIVNNGKHYPRNQLLALHAIGDLCEFILLAEGPGDEDGGLQAAQSRVTNALGNAWGNLISGGADDEEPVFVGNKDAVALLKMTSTFLTSVEDDTLMAVVKIIQKLAECSESNHNMMLRRGFHEHLVRYTQDPNIAQEIANLAVIALTYFATNPRCVVPLIKAGAVQPIIRLGQSSSESLQKRSVEAMVMIAPEMKKNSMMEEGVFEVLAALTRSEDEDIVDLAKETQIILFGEKKQKSLLSGLGSIFKFG
eukprot:TRINITY_DN3304_c0_g1_i1.p1 TRINITY_DN3304_c0_g1~~TRINITY_DN3304_c0_g1_i1.p1  ORF type:complete len:1589 (-),score=536.96 TRINITY_DN3304_c0_g1_i1:1004-5770(-)